MENTDNTANATESESGSMTFFQRLGGIFFESGNTFQDINKKPTWLVIFIVTALLSMAFAYVVTIRVDTAAITRKAIESMPVQLSEEQLNQIEEQAAARQNSPLSRVISLIQAPIALIIVYFLLAGIFMLLFLMMSAPLKFKKALSVTIWGLAPASIVHQILGIFILFLKEPYTVESTSGIVMSNLGFAIDSKAHPVLNSFASSLDIFSLWSIILLSIGFAAISDKKLTKGKAATGIVILWVIFILCKMGFSVISASFRGIGG
jgi:hypothetical protein